MVYHKLYTYMYGEFKQVSAGCTEVLRGNILHKNYQVLC